MSENAAQSSQNKKAVFVIEDDAFLLKAYQVKFGKEGIEAWTAKDGKEALAFLEKEPPNVILLDLMLPFINGWEVLSGIRKNSRWSKVPVVILSNLGQPQDVERGKELGATEYIVKANVHINEVVEIVKKYF